MYMRAGGRRSKATRTYRSHLLCARSSGEPLLRKVGSVGLESRVQSLAPRAKAYAPKSFSWTAKSLKLVILLASTASGGIYSSEVKINSTAEWIHHTYLTDRLRHDHWRPSMRRRAKDRRRRVDRGHYGQVRPFARIAHCNYLTGYVDRQIVYFFISQCRLQLVEELGHTP